MIGPLIEVLACCGTVFHVTIISSFAPIAMISNPRAATMSDWLSPSCLRQYTVLNNKPNVISASLVNPSMYITIHREAALGEVLKIWIRRDNVS